MGSGGGKDAPAPLVLVVGLGRGGGGKSTGLAEVVWRAEAQGRRPIVGDFDAHKSGTLSRLFPGEAVSPETEELPDCKACLNGILNRMVRERRSGVLDFGAGDPVLKEHGRDLRLVEFCDRRSIEPVAMFFLGPEEEDLNHVLSIWRAGFFRPRRVLLVCNEGVIREGKTVAGAFGRTLRDPGFEEMVAEGAVPILMQRLPCMEMVKRPGFGFYEAAAGRGESPLEPVEQFMAEEWTLDLEAKRQRSGAHLWLA